MAARHDSGISDEDLPNSDKRKCLRFSIFLPSRGYGNLALTSGLEKHAGSHRKPLVHKNVRFTRNIHGELDIFSDIQVLEATYSVQELREICLDSQQGEAGVMNLVMDRLTSHDSHIPKKPSGLRVEQRKVNLKNYAVRLTIYADACDLDDVSDLIGLHAVLETTSRGWYTSAGMFGIQSCIVAPIKEFFEEVKSISEPNDMASHSRGCGGPSATSREQGASLEDQWLHVNRSRSRSSSLASFRTARSRQTQVSASSPSFSPVDDASSASTSHISDSISGCRKAASDSQTEDDIERTKSRSVFTLSTVSRESRSLVATSDDPRSRPARERPSPTRCPATCWKCGRKSNYPGSLARHLRICDGGHKVLDGEAKEWEDNLVLLT